MANWDAVWVAAEKSSIAKGSNSTDEISKKISVDAGKVKESKFVKTTAEFTKDESERTAPNSDSMFGSLLNTIFGANGEEVNLGSDIGSDHGGGGNFNHGAN